MSSLASRALILTLAKFINVGMTILIGMALSRLLSKSQYGDYRQIWLIFQTVSPLMVMSLDDSVMFYLPQLEHSRHRGFLLQTVAMLGTLGVLLSSVFFFGSDMIAAVYGQSVAPYLRAFALYPAFFLPALVAPLWLIASRRVLPAALLTVGLEIVRAVGTVALVFLQVDLSVVFLWATGVALVSFAVMLRLIYHTYRGQEGGLDWGLARSQWCYSLPLGVASVLSNTLKRLSQNVVAVTFTAETFAVFANGAFEIPFLSPLTSSVMLVLIPEFVRLGELGKHQKILSLWLESLRHLAVFVYPMAVFFFLFATPTMVFLFSEKYADSAAVFRIFTLILPLRTAQYGAILRALNRTKWILWSSLVSLVTTLVLSVILLPLLGVFAPACATVIGIYLLAGMSLWLISRLLNVSFWAVYPWKELAKLAILSVLAAVPTQLLIVHRAWSPMLLLITGALAYGFVYFSTGLTTGVIRHQDLSFVTDIVRQVRLYARRRAFLKP